MVTPIPTFQSNRTLTPVAPVSFNGDRAMASAFGDVGKVFDQLGAFAERKLYERMEREQTILGQEIASSKGFDPNSLPDPRTAADKIYRESALQTYAISVEHDVTTRLNGLYLANHRNPNGFAKAADAYVTNTVDALPPELKNGVSKLAMSMAAQKHFSLLAENQKRVLAENEKTEAMHLERLKERARGASEGELEEIILRGGALFGSSQNYATPEGRNEAAQRWARDLHVTRAYHAAANGGSIDRIEKNLAANGIYLDESEKNVLYGQYAMNDSYNQKRHDSMLAAQGRHLEGLEKAHANEVYLAKKANATPEELDAISSKYESEYFKAGGGVENIHNARQLINTFAKDKATDDDATRAAIRMMTANGQDPTSFIKQSIASGNLTQFTGANEIIEWNRAAADPDKIAFVNRPLSEVKTKFYPLVDLTPLQVEAMGAKQKAEYINQVNAYHNERNKVARMMMDGSDSVDVNQYLVQKYGQMQESRAADRITHHSTEHQSRASGLYLSDNFTYEVYETGRNGAASPKYRIEEGPWTQENAAARIKKMEMANQALEDLHNAGIKVPRPKGQPEFPKDFIKEMKRVWNVE